MLWMPSCSLPDLEEEVPVVTDSIGLTPYVLDEAVGAFERPVGHVVQHPVPDSVPMVLQKSAEPVELFAAGGLGHRKPFWPVLVESPEVPAFQGGFEHLPKVVCGLQPLVGGEDVSKALDVPCGQISSPNGMWCWSSLISTGKRS